MKTARCRVPIMGTGLRGSVAGTAPRRLSPVILPASATRAGSPAEAGSSPCSAFYQVWCGAGLGLFFLLKAEVVRQWFFEQNSVQGHIMFGLQIFKKTELVANL